MPRYYFDVQDGDHFVRDEEGIDCGSRAAVRDAAIGALPGMASDVLPDGDAHDIEVLVRDETGCCVFKASLSLKSGWQD